ncbi:hypothetical protein P8452_64061 [Trifolium repens]|nr:hypothetical protein P8452_64061 [Trifolium repens]
MVKRARFGKEDQKEESPVMKTVLPRRRVAMNVKVIEGVSFKSLLLKGRETPGVVDERVEGEGKKNRLHCVNDLAPLQIHVCDSTLKELEGSKVGLLKNSVDLLSFQERLMLEGIHEIKATNMGGNLVLLQGSCAGELEEVMRCNKVWWDKCFSKIIPWSPNLVSESRETWIQIFGIPLHAWDESCFKSVAGRFGVFLDFDEATIAKHRLDMARVKLRTVRRVLIDTVVQLSVMGSTFDVWVVEERCGCGDEGRVEEVGSNENSGRSSMNSGAEVWQGEKGEVFSDSTTDSDKSEYQVEVDLQQKGGSKVGTVAGPSAGVGLEEGYCVDTFPCQSQLEVMVGEKLQDSQCLGGQEVGLGDRGVVIPRDEGVEVLGYIGERGALVSVSTGVDCDVSRTKEREDEVGVLNLSSEQLVECGGHMESDADPGSWNPFVDPNDDMGPEFLGLACDGRRVESSLVLEEVSTYGLEGGFIKDKNQLSDGAHGTFSDLSSSPTQEESNAKLVNKKTHEKQSSKFSTLPLVGAPLSRMIAMSSMPVGRRRKTNGEGSKKGVRRGRWRKGWRNLLIYCALFLQGRRRRGRILSSRWGFRSQTRALTFYLIKMGRRIEFQKGRKWQN